MKSLEIVNEKIEWCYECETPVIAIGLDGLQQIQADLEVLEILPKYISSSYIKNLISEEAFSLNNFDWDIKDEKRLINRMEELLKIKQWLEDNKDEKEN